ncbi:Conserved_hypothetical protein [Hexamita inflata]|uniref:Transmembrane protein n=1 Tax=Hexamita inflata TaxID=28002 RepID=A0ABP1HPG7_9EUKA
MDKNKCKRVAKNTLFVICVTLFSPVIVAGGIVFLIFLAIILPIQYIFNYNMLKNYDSIRRRKFLSYTTKQKYKCVERIDQLMFVFKPINSLDLYFSINNGNVEIINRNFECLHQHPIKYQFTPRQSESFCSRIYQNSLFKGAISETSYLVPPSSLTNVVFCQNKIYFCVLDQIFVVNEDLSVDLVQYITEFGQYRRGYVREDFGLLARYGVGGQIFTMNNKIYVHNQSSKLFQLKQNNKLKCVKRKHFNVFYYQFCDMVYAVNNSNISIVNQQLKFIIIKQLYDFRIVFVYGCVLVLTGANELNPVFYVLNMLDAKVITVKNNEISLLQYEVELGPTGTQLKNEILVKLFGEDFPQRMTAYYNNYHNNNMAVCQSNFLKSFFYPNIDLVTQTQWNKTFTQFDSIQSKIKYQQSKISKEISNLTVKYNLASSTFASIFYESQFQ